MAELKITPQHLERDAYLYVRQSTARQVVENTESTQRQYALRDRAVALGWPLERIHVLDCDLGKSGSQSAGRDGFQKLVSEVALGKAGLVMGLEVSRLARNSADWHRLIELCSLAGALILDEDGIYDPANFNDRLLLGLKGTMSEAELHFLKARMRGGMLNKARRGELQMRPPIGLVYRDDGVLILDPDSEVQAAMRLVFETFERTGSAMQTAKLFREQGLRFPRRIRKGVNKGDLHWVRRPPIRASCRCCTIRATAVPLSTVASAARRLPDGKHATTKVPRSQWQFVIPDVHVGYISWQQFEANQKRLADNALGFGGARKAGPAREGPALLQGRVLCGICGERMSIHYNLVASTGRPHLCLSASLGQTSREGLPARAGQRGRSGDQQSLARTDAADDTSSGPRRTARSGGPRKRNSDACGVNMLNVPSTRPNLPGVATCRSIPKIVWWPIAWKRSGIASCVSWLKRNNNTTSRRRSSVC